MKSRGASGWVKEAVCGCEFLCNLAVFCSKWGTAASAVSRLPLENKVFMLGMTWLNTGFVT
jgi:hypothetical protein